MTMTEELSNRLAENFLPEEVEEIAAAMKACQPVEISCIAWMGELEAALRNAQLIRSAFAQSSGYGNRMDGICVVLEHAIKLTRESSPIKQISGIE